MNTTIHIIEQLKCILKPIIFADDTNLFCSNKDIKQLNRTELK